MSLAKIPSFPLNKHPGEHRRHRTLESRMWEPYRERGFMQRGELFSQDVSAVLPRGDGYEGPGASIDFRDTLAYKPGDPDYPLPPGNPLTASPDFLRNLYFRRPAKWVFGTRLQRTQVPAFVSEAELETGIIDFRDLSNYGAYCMLLPSQTVLSTGDPLVEPGGPFSSFTYLNRKSRQYERATGLYRHTGIFFDQKTGDPIYGASEERYDYSVPPGRDWWDFDCTRINTFDEHGALIAWKENTTYLNLANSTRTENKNLLQYHFNRAYGDSAIFALYDTGELAVYHLYTSVTLGTYDITYEALDTGVWCMSPYTRLEPGPFELYYYKKVGANFTKYKVNPVTTPDTSDITGWTTEVTTEYDENGV